MAEFRPLRLSDIVTEEPKKALAPAQRPADFPVETEEERRARAVSASDLIQKEAGEARAQGDTELAAANERELARLKRISAPEGTKQAPAKSVKWKDITSSPKYQALDNDGRESVRLDYWQNYVSPQIATEDLEGARKEFDELTKPSLGKRIVEGVKRMLTAPPVAEGEFAGGEFDAPPERKATAPAEKSTEPVIDIMTGEVMADPGPRADWGEVVKNLPAGMASTLNTAIANLTWMGAEEERVGREEALKPGSDPLGYRASPQFRKIERNARQRHEAGLAEATKAGEAAKAAAKQAERDTQLVTPKDMSIPQQALWSGISSAPPTVLGIGIGILTRNPALAMAIAGGGGMGLEAGHTYGEARLEHGAEHRTAAAAGGIAGILEGVGEALPLQVALKAGTPIFKRIFSTIAAEAGQEAATQVMQDLSAYLIYNQKITLQEAWHNLQVATLAGGMMGGLYGSVGAAADVAAGKAQEQADGEPAARPGVDLSDPAALSREVAGEPPAPGSEAIDVSAVRGSEEPSAGPVEAPTKPAAATEPTPPAGATVAPGQEPGAAAPAGEVKPEPAKPAKAVKPKEEAGAAAPAPTEPAGGEPAPEKPAAPQGGETEPPPPRGSRRPEEAAGPQPEGGLEGAAKGLKKIFESPVDEQAHEAASSPLNEKPEPTKPQIIANNAELGHPRVGGMEISIENPAESVREDKKNTPPKWRVKMKDHYGYIRGTIGFDKDHLDAFVKPGTTPDWTGTVFVVNQNKGNGHFDEHKSMVGFDTIEEAREAYLRNFDDRARAEKAIRSIVPITLGRFKTWAYDKTENGPRGGELKSRSEQGWKEIGKNATGEALFEDARGVRSIVRDVVRITETVGIVPTRQGIAIERRPHKGEYLTKEEADAAQTGKQQPGGQPERERDGEQLQGERPDREHAPAKPAPRPEDRGRGGDEQGRPEPAPERPAAPESREVGYGALEGREVTLEVEVEGKKATLKMDAAKAMRDVDRRIATMRELVECLGA